MKLFNTNVTKDQSRDTGMAMVLLLLIVYSFRRQDAYILAAATVHVLNMIVPQMYRPVAVVWLGLSHLIGTVMSKLMLTLVFFGVVTPIGLVRRLMGYDSLKLKDFKAGEESVMAVRNHTFTGPDIEKPY